VREGGEWSVVTGHYLQEVAEGRVVVWWAEEGREGTKKGTESNVMV